MARFAVTTVEHQLREETAQRRFQTSLLSLFSLISLLLSAIGVYGLMHYLVTQRRQEMAVRMALGAGRQNVLGLVLWQGMVLAFIGIGIGVCAGLGLTRSLRSLLYGVTTTDPLTFFMAALILLGVAALACWLPARQATRIDPILALRQE